MLKRSSEETTLPPRRLIMEIQLVRTEHEQVRELVLEKLWITRTGVGQFMGMDHRASMGTGMGMGMLVEVEVAVAVGVLEGVGGGIWRL